MSYSDRSLNSSSIKGYQNYVALLKRPAQWLVALFAVAVIVLKVAGIESAAEPSYLLFSLDFVFVCSIAFFIVVAAARGFLYSGVWSLIWLGGGMLALGLTMLLGSAFLQWLGTNAGITVYNAGSLLASILFLLAAFFAGNAVFQVVKRPLKSSIILQVYAGVGVLFLYITIVSLLNLLPPFFVEGTGFTVLRQSTVGASAISFFISSLVFLREYLRTRGDLFYWLCLGMGLLFLGTVGIWIQPALGTPLNWVGRVAQILAGPFLLMAVVSVMQEAKSADKRADEVLSGLFRSPEFTYDLVAGISKDAVITSGAGGKILLFNPAALKMFGLSCTEADKLTIFDLFESENARRLRKEIEELEPADNRQIFPEPSSKSEEELVARRRDGSSFPVTISVSARRSPAGWVTVTSITDITERKNAQEALARAKDDLESRVQERTAELQRVVAQLREAGNFNESLLKSSPIAIVVMGRDGSIKYANPQFEKLTGYSEKEILGIRPPFPWWPEHSYRDSIRHLQSAAGGVTKKVERLIITSAGENRWTETTLIPVLVESKLRLVLATSVDITESKRLRDELKLYSRKLSEAQEAERKRVATELHEDTVQSLAILNLELDWFLSSGEILSEKTFSRLSRLRKQVSNALENVRKYSYRLRPSTLEHLGLTDALEELAESCRIEGQMDIEFHAGGEPYRPGEEAELALYRVAEEALSNAARHSRASRADIRLIYRTDKIVMIISDNGQGFDSRAVARSALINGSVGLVSMREKAQSVGASLEIKSKPGEGTSVKVRLPLSTPEFAIQQPHSAANG